MKTIIISVYIPKENNKEKMMQYHRERSRKEKTMKEKKMLQCSLTILIDGVLLMIPYIRVYYQKKI